MAYKIPPTHCHGAEPGLAQAFSRVSRQISFKELQRRTHGMRLGEHRVHANPVLEQCY